MKHMVIYRGSQSSDAVDPVAIKQLYTSDYFETALDLSVCVRDSSRSDEKGFYLITVKGSRQAGLTGPRGAIIRKAAVSRTRSSLEASLTHVRRVLESSQDSEVQELTFLLIALIHTAQISTITRTQLDASVARTRATGSCLVTIAIAAVERSAATSRPPIAGP